MYADCTRFRHSLGLHTWRIRTLTLNTLHYTHLLQAYRHVLRTSARIRRQTYQLCCGRMRPRLHIFTRILPSYTVAVMHGSFFPAHTAQHCLNAAARGKQRALRTAWRIVYVIFWRVAAGAHLPAITLARRGSTAHNARSFMRFWTAFTSRAPTLSFAKTLRALWDFTRYANPFHVYEHSCGRYVHCARHTFVLGFSPCISAFTRSRTHRFRRAHALYVRCA